jgi:hypothetical protein
VDSTDSVRDRTREALRHFLASAKDLVEEKGKCADVRASIANIQAVRHTGTVTV